MSYGAKHPDTGVDEEGGDKAAALLVYACQFPKFVIGNRDQSSEISWPTPRAVASSIARRAVTTS